MVHELKSKNIFHKSLEFLKNSNKKILFAYIFLGVFAVVIALTFALSQQRQNIIQNASYNATSREYIATFDGSPTSPMPLTQRNQNEFDIQAHSRDIDSWPDGSLPSMNAQHGPGCEGPDVSHVVDDYEETVFNCKDHMMTAINGSAGYGQIVVTPSYIADWKDGELVIKFNMSTKILSLRDWVTISITPWDDNLALIEESEGETPDLSGAPRNAIYFTVGSNPFSICVHDIRNGEGQNPVGWTEGNDCDHWDSIENYLTPSSIVRSPFELRISSNRITASLMNADGTVLNTWHDYKPSNHGLGPIPFNEGLVQFTQHSYTPTKDNSGVPATWHWDNLYLSDATPFTMIKADKRRVTSNGESITFNKPAPANSMLRFHATGNVDVSFDGGAFQQAKTPFQILETSASYFTPMPEGTTKATFRFSKRSWWNEGGPFQAKDFAIWSKTYDGTIQNPQPTTMPTTAKLTQAPSATPTNSPTPAPQASTGVMSVNPSTKTLALNETFTAEIRVNTGGQNINVVETTMNVGSNLDLVSIEAGDLEIEAENTVSGNTATIAFGSTNPKSGNVLVATVTLRATSVGSANITLTDSSALSSTTNTDILDGVQGGTYTIVAPTPTPTNTPTPTSTPTPTATPTLPPPTPTPTMTPAQKADFNNSGIVDIQDLSYLLSNWNSTDPTADINGDGNVTITDLSVLLSNWGK